ncbi:DUF6658 family protein [Kamptonema formosum]|uniref:DUF6658 family protein n=1 Tax=Kamptonema formosum TaxID=331992 RepID=UPI00036EB64C
MKKLTALLKKLRLHQILTVLLAGVLLLFSTACNSGGGDMRGARPDSPTVQAGGLDSSSRFALIRCSSTTFF